MFVRRISRSPLKTQNLRYGVLKLSKSLGHFTKAGRRSKLHLLLHTVEDVKRFGPLSSTCAECFDQQHGFHRQTSNKQKPGRDILEKHLRSRLVTHLLNGGFVHLPNGNLSKAGHSFVELHQHPAFRPYADTPGVGTNRAQLHIFRTIQSLQAAFPFITEGVIELLCCFWQTEIRSVNSITVQAEPYLLKKQVNEYPLLDVMLEVENSKVIWLRHDQSALSSYSNQISFVNEDSLGAGTVMDTASLLLDEMVFAQSVNLLTKLYGFSFAKVGAVNTTTTACDAFYAPGHLIVAFQNCVLDAPALGLYRRRDSLLYIYYNTRTQKVRLPGKYGIHVL